jgi:phosphatidylglycerophosphate synthase
MASRWNVWHALAMLLALGVCIAIRVLWPLALVAVPSFALLIALAHRRWTRDGAFGAANALTTMRSALLVTLAVFGQRDALKLLSAGLLVVLVLDGVDGWLARRFRTSSDFGARFDTEVDAFLVLTGCVSLFVLRGFAWWVLIGGALRYLTVLLLGALPARRGEPPRSEWGRRAYVFAAGGIVAAHCLPLPAATLAAASSTIALAVSFSASLLFVYF